MKKNPKLKALYEGLKSNKYIQGIPESYDSFESALKDDSKRKAFYEGIKSNKYIQGLPDTFDDFNSGLGFSKKKTDPSLSRSGSGSPQTPQLPLDDTEKSKLGETLFANLEAQNRPLSAGQIDEKLTTQEQAELAAKPPAPTGMLPVQAVSDEKEKDFQKDFLKAQSGINPNEFEAKDLPKYPGYLANIAKKTIWDFSTNKIPGMLASTGAALIGIEDNVKSKMQETLGMNKTLTKVNTAFTNEVQKELLQFNKEQDLESREEMKGIVSSYKDVESPLDALNYVTQAAAQSIPQIAAAYASGGASSFAQQAGSIYFDSVKRIAQQRLTTVDQVIDAGLDEPAVAATYGFIGAVMDKVGANKVMSSALGKQALSQELRVKAKAYASAMGAEAATEVGQTATEIAGAADASGMGTNRAIDEAGRQVDPYIDAAIQGAIGAGAIKASADVASQAPKLPEKAKGLLGRTKSALQKVKNFFTGEDLKDIEEFEEFVDNETDDKQADPPAEVQSPETPQDDNQEGAISKGEPKPTPPKDDGEGQSEGSDQGQKPLQEMITASAFDALNTKQVADIVFDDDGGGRYEDQDFDADLELSLLEKVQEAGKLDGDKFARSRFGRALSLSTLPRLKAEIDAGNGEQVIKGLRQAIDSSTINPKNQQANEEIQEPTEAPTDQQKDTQGEGSKPDDGEANPKEKVGKAPTKYVNPSATGQIQKAGLSDEPAFSGAIPITETENGFESPLGSVVPATSVPEPTTYKVFEVYGLGDGDYEVTKAAKFDAEGNVIEKGEIKPVKKDEAKPTESTEQPDQTQDPNKSDPSIQVGEKDSAKDSESGSKSASPENDREGVAVRSTKIQKDLQAAKESGLKPEQYSGLTTIDRSLSELRKNAPRITDAQENEVYSEIQKIDTVKAGGRNYKVRFKGNEFEVMDGNVNIPTTDPSHELAVSAYKGEVNKIVKQAEAKAKQLDFDPSKPLFAKEQSQGNKKKPQNELQKAKQQLSDLEAKMGENSKKKASREDLRVLNRERQRLLDKIQRLGNPEKYSENQKKNKLRSLLDDYNASTKRERSIQQENEIRNLATELGLEWRKMGGSGTYVINGLKAVSEAGTRPTDTNPVNRRLSDVDNEVRELANAIMDTEVNISRFSNLPGTKQSTKGIFDDLRSGKRTNRAEEFLKGIEFALNQGYFDFNEPSLGPQPIPVSEVIRMAEELRADIDWVLDNDLEALSLLIDEQIEIEKFINQQEYGTNENRTGAKEAGSGKRITKETREGARDDGANASGRKKGEGAGRKGQRSDDSGVRDRSGEVVGRTEGGDNRRGDQSKKREGKKTQERPALLYATGKESIPKPKEAVKEGDYPIDDDQLFAVNLTLERRRNRGKGFFLADGTGVGKTRQILAIANELSKEGRVLIITENQQIIDNNFTDDAASMGVDLSNPNIEIGTYSGLRTGKVGQDEYVAVIYDEAHNLKNADSGKSIAADNVKSEFYVFATATPMDTPPGAVYFASIVTDRSEDDVYSQLGFSVSYERKPNGDKIRKVSVSEGTDPKKINQNIIQLRNEIIAEGGMVRREYPFFGEITESSIPLNEDQSTEQTEINEHWEVQMEEASPKKRMNLSGQRTGELSRWNEAQKIDYAVQRAKQLASEGKKVVVIAERINETEIKGLGGRMVPGFITEFVNAMEAAGLKVAKVYGNNKKTDAVKAFQGGEADVLVGTPQSASTGINLDDQVGDSPRVLLMVTPNYSGNIFQQILGRVSRRNTKSPAAVELVYTKSDADAHRKRTVDKKLTTLRAIQDGRIDDEVDLGAPEKTSENEVTIHQMKDGKVGLSGGKGMFKHKLKIFQLGGRWDRGKKKYIFSQADLNNAIPELQSLGLTVRDSRGQDLSDSDSGSSNLRASNDSKGSAAIGSFGQRTGPRQNTTPKFKMYERVIDIIRKYNPGAFILQGRTSKGAIGTYFSPSGAIAVKGFNDVSTAFHELAHALDQRHGIIRKLLSDTRHGDPLRKRMTDIYEQYYPGAKRTHALNLRMVEAYAVLLQKYIENPTIIQSEYPDLVELFLDKDGVYAFPEVADFVNDAGNLISDYQGLTDYDKVGANKVDSESQLVDRTIRQSVNRAGDKMAEELADDLHFMEKASKKSGVFYTADDFTQWARFSQGIFNIIANNIEGGGWFNGGVKEQFWNIGANGNYEKKHDFNYRTIDKKLKRLGKEQNIDADDMFNNYLIARRIYEEFQYMRGLMQERDQLVAEDETRPEEDKQHTERIQQLREDIADIRSVLRKDMAIDDENELNEMAVSNVYHDGKVRFAEIEQMYDALVAEDLNTLNHSDVRLMDDDKKAELDARKGYTPFVRQFYNEIIGEEASQKVAAYSAAKLKAGLGTTGGQKKRTGGSQPILSPLLASKYRHEEVQRRASQQIVLNKMFDNIDKLSDYIKLESLKAIPDGAGKMILPQSNDPNIVFARGKDGTIKPMLVMDQDIKRALDESLTPQNVDPFFAILQAATRLFRTGTTSAYIPFVLVNLTLDSVTAFTQTKTNAVPVISPLKEIGRALTNKNSEEHKYWREYLVVSGFTQNSLNFDRPQLRDRAKNLKGARKVGANVLRGMNAITDALAMPGNYAEVINRATEYIRARKAGDTMVVAKEKAGRVTAPFHHKGRFGSKSGQNWARTVAYFPAALAVLAQTIRTVASPEGRKRYIIAASAIAAASGGAVAYALYGDDEEAKAIIKSKNAEELSKYIFLPDPMEKGKLTQVRVPEQIGMWAGLLNMGLVQALTEEKYSFGDYAEVATAPVPQQFKLWQAEKWLFSVMPHAIKPAIEVVTNTKTFPNIRPIESPWERSGKQPEFRYNQWNSPFAIEASRVMADYIPLSPKMIDHLIGGYGGRLFKQLTMKPGYRPDELNSWFRSFQAEFYLNASRQAQDYYDLRGKVDQKISDFEAGRGKIKGKEAKGLYVLQSELDYTEELMQLYNNTDPDKQPRKADKLRAQVFKAFRDLNEAREKYGE